MSLQDQPAQIRGGSWRCSRIRIKGQCAIAACWRHQWPGLDCLRQHLQFQSSCGNLSDLALQDREQTFRILWATPASTYYICICTLQYLLLTVESCLCGSVGLHLFEAILTVIMGIRFAKTKKVMPAGMVAMLSSGGLIYNLLKIKQ